MVARRDGDEVLAVVVGAVAVEVVDVDTGRQAMAETLHHAQPAEPLPPAGVGVGVALAQGDPGAAAGVEAGSQHRPASRAL